MRNNNSNQKHFNEQSISRYELKEKLNGMEKVDISSFDQSKNQMSKCNYSPITSQVNSIFPSIDAQTLQFQHQSQKKVYKAQKFQHGQKKKYYEDPTQRNKKSKQLELQAQNKLLKKMIQEKEIQLAQILQVKDSQNLKIKNYETQMKKKQEQIMTQKQQIKLLKDREIKLTNEKDQVLRQYNNSVVSNNHSYVSGVGMSSYYIEDVSSFSPQMLSPEETILLLSKLLKKVSKSSTMIKQLTQENSVKQILTKMSKK